MKPTTKKSRRSDDPGTETSPRTADLFVAEHDPHEADEGGADGVVETQSLTSIEAFARKQRALYEAGMKSASEFWAAKGITWPRK